MPIVSRVRVVAIFQIVVNIRSLLVVGVWTIAMIIMIVMIVVIVGSGWQVACIIGTTPTTSKSHRIDAAATGVRIHESR